MSPRQRTGLDVRIRRAARERFLLHGVDGASLREIAADAGTSVGMVHYYFQNKEGLFLQVVEEVYAGLLEDLGRVVAADDSVEARVEQLFDRFARIDDEELVLIRLVLREVLVSSSRRATIVERFSRGHLPLLARLLLEGTREGKLDAALGPVPLLLGMVSLALLPQVFGRLAGELGKDSPFVLPEPQELAQALSQLFLRGARPRPPRKRR